ncbi:MAG: TlpA family protein disulfide reductase [Gammaproteobacteria bacterium]|nr:TlpA family protein disulfide reductase [Gammaproteobacteria bacterium]
MKPLLFLVLALLAFVTQANAAVLGTDLQGKQQDLSQYRGKWVVVNYWATWCPPCLKEMPELESFHNNHKAERAVVVGINMENISEERLRKFVGDQGVSFPIVPTKPASKSVFGKLDGMPTTYLIDPKGELVAKQEGGITANELENFINNHN